MKTSELDGMHYDTVKSPWGQRVERGDFDEDAPPTHTDSESVAYLLTT